MIPRKRGRPIKSGDITTTVALPNLGQARIDAGLSQRELSEKLGIPESTLWNWERGTTRAPVRVVASIARAVKSTASYILGR